MRKTGVERFGASALMIFAGSVLAALVLAGCGGNKSNGAAEPGKQISPAQQALEKKNFSSEPPPIQISTGDISGFKVAKPTVIVVKDINGFKSLKKRIFSHGVKQDNVADIDFKTRQAVALIMPKLQKGTIIVITDVHQEGNKIVLLVVKMLPGKNCAKPKYTPNPYQVVETRKMTPNTTTIKMKTNVAGAC